MEIVLVSTPQTHGLIRRVHLTEMRTALDEARASLGMQQLPLRGDHDQSEGDDGENIADCGAPGRCAVRGRALGLPLLALTVAPLHAGEIGTPKPTSGANELHSGSEAVTSYALGAYSYDGSGNIIGIGSNTYRYDAAGRLVSATVEGQGNQETYTYDALGNRIGVSHVGTGCAGGLACSETITATPAITPATNHINAGVATYDEAGNVIAMDAVHTYAFDAAGAMTWQNDNGSVRKYVYTADDERLGVYNGRWTWTVRDLGGRVLRELTSEGLDGTSSWKWRKDYVYWGPLLLASEVQNYDGNDNA